MPMTMGMYGLVLGDFGMMDAKSHPTFTVSSHSLHSEADKLILNASELDSNPILDETPILFCMSVLCCEFYKNNNYYANV